MPSLASILIVDDDANICRTLSEILEKKGYVTTAVDSGHRAIELSKEKPFDVILMDIKMPVMCGVEACKKIRQIRPSAAVVFMTAYAPEDLVSDMVGESGYMLIKKPYDIDNVISVIEKYGGKGLAVTLVDADITLRNTMQNGLKGRGYSITVCKSGEEAIALAKAKPRDIFFLDTELPILSALETYLEIRKANPKAVVVLMTAHRQKTEEMVRQTIEKGAYSCLYKPFDMDEAVEIIEKIIEKKEKGRAG